MSSTNDVKKKSMLTHLTSIFIRPKPEEKIAPTATCTPEAEAKKVAEAEEKRKKMLEAYSKHCDDSKANVPEKPEKMPEIKFRMDSRK